ncbi:alginate lyase family protein [Acidicapsa ligni]|uniref:alginate lyase family protein n=1 Tax=Acidicapsa ligni TaxID=542300 RepID=UPI0021DFAD82|nr:alginate lyase family protein [Acidicapsa ligni]
MPPFQSPITRRQACKLLATVAIPSASTWALPIPKEDAYKLVAANDRQRILKAAANYLPLQPQTITAFPSLKIPGGPHDFFSQADYFWPDPQNPSGPYINRDGQSNPENFNDHRKAMIALSIQMPALTAAWLLTRDRNYGQQACNHLRAWFINPATRMNPNLEYSQGVHGVSTGRSWGIIDTLHLVEVARAASIVSPHFLNPAEQTALKDWFRSYLQWLKTSDKGQHERDAQNNHATCWALQASEFARLIDDTTTRSEIHRQYTEILLPDQLGLDGSFPKELARTKPYSYSIFNFDVMATLCQSLKSVEPELLTFQLPDGRGICKAAHFIYPYLKDKTTWPYVKDVEHFEALPVRSPGLLFTGLACHQQPNIALWKTLNPDPTDHEVIRNNPIRQPLLWI